MGRIYKGIRKMNMILIAGRARVGKTTFAKLIAEQIFKMGQTPILLSFADPIKEEAKRKGYSKEHTPEKHREFCQELGEQKRSEDSDYWIRKFDDKVKSAQTQEQKDIRDKKKYWERVIIADDCRYLNEIAYGTLYSATMLFLSSGKRKLTTGNWRKHKSEELATSLEAGLNPLIKSFNGIICNDKTIEELQKIIKNNISVWSGAVIECEKEECNCHVCKGRRDGTLPPLEEVIENLMDLFTLDDLKNEEEKDRDDEEEDTDDSDS